ncbi:hypothetical protein [Streptomyces sp. NBC_00582]|uniref:hypothetical protein n=1 Tax=Streptomyces sp. NBC_00582 TaxID=2975783 RepID=UPI001063CA29|nr:hypothetical protein [Streptomyces sp. NBC_00582]WUB60492.1 hypothetical protein OG852_08870 [Streptomyces sp. NBC_00582]
MSTTGAPVVVLDFREGRDVPDEGAALRRTVAERLPGGGRTGSEDLRFLVIDTPDGLTAHAEAYELVTASPTLGSVGLLCLVVGGLPDSRDAAVPVTDGAGRRLRLASVLRSAGTGVLWAADPRAGHDPRTDDPDGEREAALLALTDVLCIPEVFDEVLAELRGTQVSVAALSLRVLEHDLSAAVRERAWRTALTRFAGDDAPGAAQPAAQDLPPALAGLLGPGPERFTASLLRAGGPAEAAHRSCVQALSALDEARADLASATALLTGRRTAAEVPRAVERAVDALRRHRESLAGVLRDTGSPGIPSGEAFGRLADAGIELPPPDGPSRAGDPGGGLQGFATRLLTSGQPLRAVAARLSALAERVAPVPAAARLHDLERACPEEALRRVSAGRPLYFARARAGYLALTALIAAVSALWPWPGTLLVLLPAAVFLLGGLCATAAHPGRSAGGRTHRADLARSVALLLGAVAGFALGRTVGVPHPAALAGVLLGLIGAGVCVAVWWRRAIARWWEETGATDLHTRLTGLETVLADALRRQWWAADDRTRCADGARTLAAVLRGAAAEAETGRAPEGAPDGTAGRPAGQDGWTDPDWGDAPWDDTSWEDGDWPEDGHDGAPAGPGPGPLSAEDAGPGSPVGPGPYEKAPGAGVFPSGPPGAHPGTGHRADPPWLDRGAGDGGPDLVPTLVADLADATVDALRRHAGTAGPDAAAAARAFVGAMGTPSTLEAAVRQAIVSARLHLRHSGVVPAPPFARRDRLRGDPMALLGIGSQRVREALGSRDQQAGPLLLCPPAQLSLLSRDPEEARSITFAPQAVRSVVETRPGPDHEGGRTADGTVDRVVWTASGRFAGRMRLIPLRTGVVESVRVRTWADGDGAAYPGPEGGTAPDTGQEWAQR